MFDLGDLVIIAVLSGIGLILWRGMATRERTIRWVNNYLQRLGLQLLDQNVAVKGFWFKRDKNNSLRTWYSYTFEFTSTGHERYPGKVVVLGGAVTNIELAPYRLPDSESEDD